MTKLKLQISKPDWLIIGLPVAFALLSLLVVFDASSVVAARDFGNRFYYLQNQVVWVLLGVMALLVLAFFDYHKLAKLSFFGLVLVIFLLILVLIPQFGAQEVLGAKRRLSIAGIVVQPSELAKLVYLVYLSFRFSALAKPFPIWQFVIITGIILGLIVAEPDLGTAFILGVVGFVIYFIAGAPIKNFVILGLIFLLVTFGLIFSAEYRQNRFLGFLNLSADSQGISYHQNQILLGLGSGGFFGTGFGSSLQKFYYLPEAATDSIFAVIGEEFGFVGATVLIFGFLLLVLRGTKIATTARDQLGRLTAAGITFLIASQVIVNLAGQVALLPLTGIPLPFISYGGSSLITLMAAIGILANISRQRVTTSK